MTKRQVNIPLASYRDPEGRVRHALSGETVDVGDEYLADFDKLVGNPPKQPPKKQVQQEPSPTSRRSVKKQAAKAAGRQPTPRKRAAK